MLPSIYHTSASWQSEGLRHYEEQGNTGEVLNNGGGAIDRLFLLDLRRRRMGGIRTKTQGYWFFFLMLGLLVLWNRPGLLLAQTGKAVTRADFEKVVNESTVELTTTGRKSGKPHTKPVWFVYDQGRLYLQAGKGGKTDWYQNLQKNPEMTLKIGTLTFNGKAKFIEDQKETERIHNLFSTKYIAARLAGMVGSSIGHGEAIEVLWE